MRRLLSLFIIFTMIITLSGCGNTSKGVSLAGNTKVFVTISNEDTFISTIVDGMNSYAGSNNIQLDVKFADKNVETQVEQVKAAKQSGYDAIVCILVDTDTSKQVINAAGDTPVIFMNVEPSEDNLKADKDIYIASNESEVVDFTEKYISNQFKDKKSFDAVLFEGDMSNKSAVERTESLKEKLKKDGFDVNYIFQDEAGWSKEKAKKMFKVFLKLKKNYDCVICNNDDMALGVIEAMKEEGIDPSAVPIFGVDATKDACKEIIDGNMAFTIKQSGSGQGESAMKAAQTLKSGGKIKDMEYSDESGKYIWYPYQTVDKSNVSQYVG